MSLFATQDIKAGDIIFCEKAFAATTPQDRQTRPAHLMATVRNSQLALAGNYDVALWKNVVDKVTRNKSTSAQLSDLAETSFVAYAPSVSANDDVFLMYKRVQRNSLTITPSTRGAGNEEQGLFVHASHIDYSCMPNTARAFVGDLLIVRATRAIKAGEQLSATETELFDDYEHTKNFISKTLRSHCECAICVAEQQTSPEQRIIRQEALELVAAYCKTSEKFDKDTSKAKLDSAISRGVQLANKLSATYDNNTFQGIMPRRGLTKLYAALLVTHTLVVNRAQHLNPKALDPLLDYPMQALQAQGCEIAVDPTGNVTFANLYGVNNNRAKRLLFDCAFGAWSSKRSKTAEQFLGYAKEMHLLGHCDTTEFTRDTAWLEELLMRSPL